MTMVDADEHKRQCSCGWLDTATRDPHVPVGFDAEVNEFHIERRDEHGNLAGQMVIYYCPFCGGTPPLSTRANLFEYVTPEENYRLGQLTKGLRSVADVLAAFGTPDEDLPAGYSQTAPEKDGQPSRTEVFRVLRYQALSPTAVVEAVVHDDDRVRFAFVSKPRASHGG